MRSIFCNPAIAWFLLNLSSSVIIGFTNGSSIIRPAVFPVFILYEVLLWPTYRGYPSRIAWHILVAIHLILFVYQYFDIALRRKWDFGSHGYLVYGKPLANGPEKEMSQTPKPTKLQRLFFGYWCTFAGRMCSTPFEVKNVAPFSVRDPSYTPTRSQFLVQKVRNWVLYYLLMDLVDNRPVDIKENRITFASRNVPLLFRTQEYPAELMVARIFSTCVYWLMTRLVIDSFMNMVAFLKVGVGLDSVASSRPMFGTAWECWNVRRFWG